MRCASRVIVAPRGRFTVRAKSEALLRHVALRGFRLRLHLPRWGGLLIFLTCQQKGVRSVSGFNKRGSASGRRGSGEHVAGRRTGGGPWEGGGEQARGRLASGVGVGSGGGARARDGTWGWPGEPDWWARERCGGVYSICLDYGGFHGGGLYYDGFAWVRGEGLLGERTHCDQ